MNPGTPIDPELAWRFRERGLRLPTTREYTNPRVAEIAKRQEELTAEHDKLDVELSEIAKSQKAKRP